MGKRLISAGSVVIGLVGSALLTAAAPTAAVTCENPALAVREYESANLLTSADAVYVVCAGSSLTLSGVRTDGRLTDPESIRLPASSVSLTTSERSEASPTRSASTGVGGGGADCDIVTVYRTECDFSFTYQKYRLTTLQWTRGVAGFARIDLQHRSQKIYMRLTSKNGFAINASGSIVLQRMQGVVAPTVETATNFSFTNGGTQTSGTVYVSRTTRDTGKYSIIFGVTRIFDKQAGAAIPIVIDPTSPRFQCYSASLKNCDFPSGQEAGVF